MQLQLWLSQISPLHWVVAVMVVIQLVVWIRLSRSQAKVDVLSKQLAQLNQEQKALLSGNLGLGRKLFKIANNLDQVEQLQDSLQQQEVSTQSIDIAGQMLSAGESVESVAAKTRMSIGEIELLKQMMFKAPVH